MHSIANHAQKDRDDLWLPSAENISLCVLKILKLFLSVSLSGFFFPFKQHFWDFSFFRNGQNGSLKPNRAPAELSAVVMGPASELSSQNGISVIIQSVGSRVEGFITA